MINFLLKKGENVMKTQNLRRIVHGGIRLMKTNFSNKRIFKSYKFLVAINFDLII